MTETQVITRDPLSIDRIRDAFTRIATMIKLAASDGRNYDYGGLQPFVDRLATTDTQAIREMIRC